LLNSTLTRLGALDNCDHLGDMVPPARNAPVGAGADGVPSALLRKGLGLHSPGGGFRFFLQDDGNAWAPHRYVGTSLHARPVTKGGHNAVG
jgi:hypothetical protein